MAATFDKYKSSELSPTEALFLFSLYDEERWTAEDALASALAYLVSSGFLEVEKESKLRLTSGGETALKSGTLTKYEKKVLGNVKSDLKSSVRNWLNPSALLNSIRPRDVAKVLGGKGLAEEEKRRRGVWIFKWTSTRYKPSAASAKMLRELKNIREELKKCIASGDLSAWEEKYGIAIAYAFPSVSNSDEFKNLARQISAEAAAINFASAIMAAAVTAGAIQPPVT